MLKFTITYFLLAVILFVIELIIALYVHDDFIRPYFGDFLVVILLYCFIKSFLNLPVLPVAIFVLLFAYFIEFLQSINFINWLGLENSEWAKMLLGNSFSWVDMFWYTAGIASVILVEYLIKKRI
ncbi:DUF2809 domain-containing protein [Sphingobacterium hungaricum]|uniref:DUF2809 domain-containing protein n=1 Tax=Sphingobacterium hungaricum TaxID=2082723 RepID=A0A928UZH0_9SPHI|nr:DUF2809 domain-containing protein [Sphingobacterium hungaricum]MBE8714275.1 DUF2809 domain-containing protein [Sphingobacterium hungaricum]